MGLLKNYLKPWEIIRPWQSFHKIPRFYDHLCKKGLFSCPHGKAGFGSFLFIACLLLNKGIHEPPTSVSLESKGTEGS